MSLTDPDDVGIVAWHACRFDADGITTPWLRSLPVTRQ
jgi:hypothetical protein